MFRTKTNLCVSCRTRPARTIKTKAGICHPWRGEVDDDLNPIDQHGNLVMPGIRTCGYKDCCNPEHVISEPEVIGHFRCRSKHVTATIMANKRIVDIPPCSVCGEPTRLFQQETKQR
jgi:hypothetical protein